MAEDDTRSLGEAGRPEYIREHPSARGYIGRRAYESVIAGARYLATSVVCLFFLGKLVWGVRDDVEEDRYRDCRRD